MLNLSGIAIRGVSIGGVETCIQLPGHDLCFDIGRCPRSAVQRSWVMFSHGHLDHMGGMAMHAATRALTGQAPPTYLVPRELKRGVENLFEAWRSLDRSGLQIRLIPVSPGERIALDHKREVVVFRSLHGMPSVGYVLRSRRNKLKDEYRGLAGERLRDLRLAGVQIAREIWAPDVAFVGDSRIDVLEKEPLVRQSRVLIMETTFLDDRVSIQQCRAKGHTHLDELLTRQELLSQNKKILLTHFSARYSPAEIRDILDHRLPDHLRERVVPLLRTVSAI